MPVWLQAKLMFYRKLGDGADLVDLLCHSPGPRASSFNDYRGTYLSCTPSGRVFWVRSLLPAMLQALALHRTAHQLA